MIWTVLVIINRKSALEKISNHLLKMKCDEDVVNISLRKDPLVPTPPPGTDQVAS